MSGTRKLNIYEIEKRIRISYAKLSKRTSGVDDCVQEILTRMLEGRHQHSTIDQAVIDYLRSTHGRPGSPGYLERQKLENAHSLESSGLGCLDQYSFGRESSNRLDFSECRGWIGNQVDKAAFGLFYKWGLSEVEIGDLFGFSESRVSQRLKRIQGSISARIKAQEGAGLSNQRTSQVACLLRPEAERNLWGVGQITFERMETGESWGMESFNEKSF